MGIEKKERSKSYNSLLRTIITFCVLAFGGALLFIRYIAYSDFSFTVLTSYHDTSSIVNPSPAPLLTGQSIRGVIRATDNNLGIVSLRFNTFKRSNDDILIFKLRRLGDAKWYNEQSARTTFEHEEFYNFGFLPIPQSQSKEYEFIITSTRGTPHNSVAVSIEDPVIATKYKYSKAELIQNKALIVQFLEKKLMHEFLYSSLMFALFIFSLPFVSYLVKKFSNPFTHNLLIAAMVMLVVYSIGWLDSLFSEAYILLPLSMAYIISAEHHAKWFLSLALSGIIMSCGFYIGGNHQSAIHAASWSWIFIGGSLVSTIVQKKYNEL